MSSQVTVTVEMGGTKFGVVVPIAVPLTPDSLKEALAVVHEWLVAYWRVNRQ